MSNDAGIEADESDPSTPYELLLSVTEGDRVRLDIDDFEDTDYPKDANPRTIEDDVRLVDEDVSHSAGEIARAIAIGDPWTDGCYVDLGNTANNKLTGGSSFPRTYTKAWRPRSRRKDRVLLGRVTDAEIIDEDSAEIQ